MAGGGQGDGQEEDGASRREGGGPVEERRPKEGVSFSPKEIAGLWRNFPRCGIEKE